MSTRLPIVSGAELVRALERAGFERRRQSGSHIILRRGKIELIIPNHHSVAKGTLASILRSAGMTSDALRELL
jgi:predicted RNA binding protein YcfA (HicA-like mRNA interferase family)